jgi:hypothetical protein
VQLQQHSIIQASRYITHCPWSHTQGANKQLNCAELFGHTLCVCSQLLLAATRFAGMGASLSIVQRQVGVPVIDAEVQQHKDQRARGADDCVPVLARNEVLDTVFSFVGIGDYYYVAGVCRSWRGRYITLCKQAAKKRQRKLHTLHMNTVVTASRLQVALDSGLTIQKLQQNVSDYSLEDAIIEQSLEPIAVLTLARVYGLQWTAKLPNLAAEYKQYDLLIWLVKCGCTLDLQQIMDFASEDDELEHMKRLHAITGPWRVHEETCTLMMNYAGLIGSINTLQWWRDLGVAWPTSFYRVSDPSRSMHDCWSLNCMQWAIANGSTWLVWRCQDLAPYMYSCIGSGCAEHSDDTCYDSCNRKGAAELFKWAHENGCPCTCNDAAAVV